MPAIATRTYYPIEDNQEKVRLRAFENRSMEDVIIPCVNEEGERIPLTVAGTNPEEGTVKIIFQIVGATTELLNHKQEGEYIQDFVGPRFLRGYAGNRLRHKGLSRYRIDMKAKLRPRV